MTVIDEYEIRHIRALRGHLAECTVLLKKDGNFPLKKALQNCRLWQRCARHS